MNRKHLTTLLAGIGLAVTPTAAFAGEGDATALHIDGVITIADCHAEDGSSNCTALSILGTEVAGSSQEGEGSSGNTGWGGEDPSGNGGGHVWLFGSESNVDGDGNSNSSSSAVSINVAGQVQVELLRAQANSNGDAESDGAWINVAGHEFHILHAGSYGGEGRAAVAIIDGNTILGSGADGGIACPLPAAPVGEADVVCASGRRAGVVDNASIGGGTVTGEAITANSRGAAEPEGPTPGVDTPRSETPIGETPGIPLARTGGFLLELLLAGALSVAAGEGLRRRGSETVTFA